MSKLTVSTVQLQALVSKVNQCVGNNKLHRITNMIGLKSVDGALQLYSTDGVNTLCVSMQADDADIDVSVNAETFVKLISKITSDSISLEVCDNVLNISGNGNYKLALELNDNGDIFSFPDNDVDADEVGTISADAIQTIQASLKSSLSVNAGSVYTNYYAGEFVAATDRAMMGVYDYPMFTSDETKFLLNSGFVDLLSLGGDSVILAYNVDTQILVASADRFRLTTKASTDCTEFNIEGINKMLAVEQDSYCKIRKKEIVDVLDRLSLFVSAYDDGAITLEFSQSSVKVSSLSSNGVEIIDYAECKNIQDKTIKINIGRLISQLKSYTSDMVDLYYGSDICIKLVDGTVTQVVALMR